MRQARIIKAGCLENGHPASIVPNFHFLDNLLRLAPSDFQKSYVLLALRAVNPGALLYLNACRGLHFIISR